MVTTSTNCPLTSTQRHGSCIAAAHTHARGCTRTHTRAHTQFNLIKTIKGSKVKQAEKISFVPEAHHDFSLKRLQETRKISKLTHMLSFKSLSF